MNRDSQIERLLAAATPVSIREGITHSSKNVSIRTDALADH
jgi:hypothetical protein